MSKGHLYIDKSASSSLLSLISFFQFFAKICIVVGIFSIFIGLNQGIMGVWIIGLSLIIAAITIFINIPILSGLTTITESAEYYKAKMESMYSTNEEKNVGMNEEIDKWLKEE